MNLTESFLQRIHVPGSPTDCWLWDGAIGSDGYGRVRRSGRTYSAHRYAYRLFKGPIPEGLCVLHRCDEPRCINPTHLFLGTKLDNSRDMQRKGRQGYSAHKLTAEQVRELRARLEAGESKRSLSEAFGVCRSTVQDIASGDSWATSTSQLELWPSKQP